jgi:hypothetical protein
MKRFLLLGLVLAGGMLSCLPALNAQAAPLQDGFTAISNIGRNAGIRQFQHPRELVIAILGVILTMLAILGVIVLMIGGAMYITSLGDEAKARKAKLLIFYAVLGLVVIGAAGIIVNLVIGLFNVAPPAQNP